MKIPVLKGVIKRRMLINFRVDPKVMQRLLPAPFRPKLHNGYAVAGICLIRLEHVRPDGFPAFVGASSENAAHRVAIKWDDSSGTPREAVFIVRRDTNSLVNHVTGGRIFSGEHHLADIHVSDDEHKVDFSMQSRDRSVSIRVRGFDAGVLPSNSCFASIQDSSRFFEAGSLGYSVTTDPRRLDGLELRTSGWTVRALAIEDIASSYFADTTFFPNGSAEFDHALIMRDIDHEWHHAAGLLLAPQPSTSAAGIGDGASL